MNTRNKNQNAVAHHRVTLGRRAFLMCTVWAALAGGRPVYAEDSAAQIASSLKSATDLSGLEEIVVTAEKRESTVQRTPLSITAISGEAMRLQGINDIGGIISTVPGISVKSAGPGQTELEMRGLSSSGGSSPTVGFYLNEIPLTPPSNAMTGKAVIDPSLFDLQRVEVLRGPQGTLYGSGSMGGTIKMITNPVDLEEFSGAVSGTVSTTKHGGENSSINAAFNLPIIKDKLGVRIVLTNNSDSGFIDRIVVSPFPQPVNACPSWNAFFGGNVGCDRGNVTGQTPSKVTPKANSGHLESARMSVLWKATENFTLDGLLMYQNIKTEGYSQIDLTPQGQSQLAVYMPSDFPEPFSDKFKLASLTGTYDLGFATLKATGSYWDRVTDQTQSATEEQQTNTQALLGIPPQPFFPIGYQEIDTSKQINGEVRLASNGNDRLSWIGGVFFSQEKSLFETFNQSVDLVANALNFLDPNVFGTINDNPMGMVYNAHNPYHVKQYAAFGEVGYQITDTLKATVGLRWYKFATDVDESQAGLLATGNGTPAIAHFESRESGVNPKLNLSYEPNRKLTIYATAAKGFRPGGVNLPIPTNIGCAITTEQYKSDSIMNYEVGEKARMFDGAVQLNSSLFYIDWKDVQQSINQSCGYPLTVNAGKARSYGGEVELTAKLSNSITASLSGAYTDSSMRSVDPTVYQATSDQPIVLQSGSPILNSPKFTSSVSIAYRTPINSTLDFLAMATNSYVSKVNDIAYRRMDIPSHDLVNLRLGVENEKWSIFAFADNVTNEQAIMTTNNTAFQWVVPSVVRGTVNRPRTIGATITAKF